DEARLVVGYSSIAQLGFIILGIFSLDPKGVDGAVFQMVNHGLVVAPLFLIIAVLTDRVGGGRLSQPGALAFRAPLLEALPLTAPHIDYQGLAPLFAVAGGSLVVLMAGLVRPRWVQFVLIPALTVVALGAAIGLSIWNWEPGDAKPIIEGALEIDTLALSISI